MRIVERYVLREVLVAGALALVVLTLIFAVATVFEMVREGISFWRTLAALPLTLPYTLPYTVAVATLAGAALGVGRLGQDGELLALQGLGVHPGIVLAPPLILGAVLGVLLLALQDRVIPVAHRAKKEVVLAFAEDLIGRSVGDDRVVDLPIGRLFIHRKSGPLLEGVVLQRIDGGRVEEIVASRGLVALDESQGLLVIELEDVSGAAPGTDLQPERGRAGGDRMVLRLPIRRNQETEIAFLPFRDLALRREAALREIEHVAAATPADLAGLTDLERSNRARWIEQLERDVRQCDMILHGRLVMSVCPVLAALVGALMAFLLGERPPLVAFVLGLLLLSALFFGPVVLGRRLALAGTVSVVPAVWSGAFLTLVAAIALASRLGRA